MHKPIEPMEVAGRRVLLVEDDYFIADELAQWLRNAGAEVIGPVGTLSEALHLLDSHPLDGAILDINLRGELAYPLADALISRGTPLVFSTGYDESAIPERYCDVTRCEKPLDPATVTRALLAQIMSR